MAPDPIRTGTRSPGRASGAEPPAEPGASGVPTSLAATERTVSGDGFEAISEQPSPALESQRNGGLPDVLLATDTATVRHGTDPGDFYCEHLYFLAQRAAAAPGSSVLCNPQGERLVGFLHVPGDPFRYSAPGEDYGLEDRHAGTREVIGAALRGYVDVAAGQTGSEPIRILLTGFGEWGSTTNNPTGEFVDHHVNVDRAMQLGFGQSLLTPEGRRMLVDATLDSATIGYSYRIRDPGSDGEREVQVHLARFTVDDSALDEAGARSIQRAIADVAPHGVISMGVHGARHFEVEHHADDGGLEGGPPPRHSGSVRAAHNNPDNYALARAVHDGDRARSGAGGGVLGFLGNRTTDDPGR